LTRIDDSQANRERSAVLRAADQVGHADSKTTLEIYAQVQKRISRNNVHAAFDRLLTGADSTVMRARL
jgi:hypothetical protein